MNASLLHSVLLWGFTLSCASPRAPGLVLPPTNAPSVHVTALEALIVFPAAVENDFPWPAQPLTDAFAGPSWIFIAVIPRRPASAASAQFWRVDSLKLSSYESLAAVVQEIRLFDCDLESPVIACGRPLDGRVGVDRSRVVISVTERAWLHTLLQHRPDSAWLRVDRPNRRTIDNEHIKVNYPQAVPR